MKPCIKKKILLIDDYSDILDSIKSVLEMSGYEVETGVCGEKLNSLDDSNLPDLFLIDYWLPGKSGYEFYTGLKSRVETQHIPIILMTADSTILKVISTIEQHDILIKPFSIDELLDKINNHLP
jgi:two-component system phosphate regulon response regulator PhoB